VLFLGEDDGDDGRELVDGMVRGFYIRFSVYTKEYGIKRADIS
jgi:hypothetical protein